MNSKAGKNKKAKWLPYKQRKLEDLGLSESCAEALLGRGLPKDTHQMFVRNAKRELEIRDLPGCGRSAFLGQFEDGDHTYWLCLSDESIWLLDGYDGDDEQETRWVNSSVTGLQGILAAWDDFMSSGLSEDDDQYDRAVSEATERAHQADLKAFEDDNSWWSLTFDEIENGVIGPEGDSDDPMDGVVIMSYPEDLE
ncbi:MAG: SUKH-4 family immunity protein [Nocardiopsaceae bacterium]|nr:SUKH-4 family immunity protein [Nocardiopsaceae bacterium]